MTDYIKTKLCGGIKGVLRIMFFQGLSDDLHLCGRRVAPNLQRDLPESSWGGQPQQFFVPNSIPSKMIAVLQGLAVIRRGNFRR